MVTYQELYGVGFREGRFSALYSGSVTWYDVRFEIYAFFCHFSIHMDDDSWEICAVFRQTAVDIQSYTMWQCSQQGLVLVTSQKCDRARNSHKHCWCNCERPATQHCLAKTRDRKNVKLSTRTVAQLLTKSRDHHDTQCTRCRHYDVSIKISGDAMTSAPTNVAICSAALA